MVSGTVAALAHCGTLVLVNGVEYLLHTDQLSYDQDFRMVEVMREGEVVQVGRKMLYERLLRKQWPTPFRQQTGMGPSRVQYCNAASPTTAS